MKGTNPTHPPPSRASIGGVGGGGGGGVGHGEVLKEVLEALQGELGALRAELCDREVEHGESLGGLALSVVEAKAACAAVSSGAARELAGWRDSLRELAEGSGAAAAGEAAARLALERSRVAVEVGMEGRCAAMQATAAAAGAEAVVLAGRVATLEAALGREDGTGDTTTTNTSTLQLSKALTACVEAGLKERAALEAQVSAAKAALASVLGGAARPVSPEQVASLQEALREALTRLDSAGQREGELRAALEGVTQAVEAAGGANAEHVAALRAHITKSRGAAAAHMAAAAAAGASAAHELAAARAAADEAAAMQESVAKCAGESLAARDDALAAQAGALLAAQALWSKAQAAMTARWEGVGEENRRLVAAAGEERRAAREAVAEARAGEAALRHALGTANEAAGEALRARDARDAGAVGDTLELARRVAASEEAGARKDEEMAGVVRDLRVALEAAEGAGVARGAASEAGRAASEAAWGEERRGWERRCEALTRERDLLASSLRAEREASACAATAAAASEAAATARIKAAELRAAEALGEAKASSDRLAAAVAVRKRMGLHLASSIPATSGGGGLGGGRESLGGVGVGDPLSPSSALWEATDVLGACALGALWAKHREGVAGTVRSLQSSLHALQMHILGGVAAGAGAGAGAGATAAAEGSSSSPPPPSLYHGAHETLRLSLLREISSLRGALGAAVDARDALSNELSRGGGGDLGGGAGGGGHHHERLESAEGALKDMIGALRPALEGAEEVKRACGVEREAWVAALVAGNEARLRELEGCRVAGDEAREAVTSALAASATASEASAEVCAREMRAVVAESEAEAVALKARVLGCETEVLAAREAESATVAAAGRERVHLLACVAGAEREAASLRAMLGLEGGKEEEGGGEGSVLDAAGEAREEALLMEVRRLREWGLAQREVGEEVRAAALERWGKLLAGGGEGGGSSSSSPGSLLATLTTEASSLKSALTSLRAALDATSAGHAKQLSALARAAAEGSDSARSLAELHAAEGQTLGSVVSALASSATRSVTQGATRGVALEGTVNALRHRLLLLSSSTTSASRDEAKLGLAAELQASGREVASLSKALKEARSGGEAREMAAVREMAALREKVEECLAAARRVKPFPLPIQQQQQQLQYHVPVATMSLEDSGDEEEDEEEEVR